MICLELEVPHTLTCSRMPINSIKKSLWLSVVARLPMVTPKHGNANRFPDVGFHLPMWQKGAPFPMGGGWFQAFSMDKKYYDAFESNDGRLKTIVTSYKRQEWCYH